MVRLKIRIIFFIYILKKNESHIPSAEITQISLHHKFGLLC